MLTQLSTSSPAQLIQPSLSRRGVRVDVREPGADLVQPGANAPAVLDFIASNETLDRYGEIILAGGWRLESYRRNPVFQNAHQYGDVLFTLGKAVQTEVRPGGANSAGPHLFQRIEFAVDVNPMARIAYGLYKSKFLNAVSVGFIPLRWETPAQPEKAGYRRKYLEQELLEVSAVGIPANPDALQLGLKAGAIEKADLRALFELLRRTGILPVRNSFWSASAVLGESNQVEDEDEPKARSSSELAAQDQGPTGGLSSPQEFCSELAVTDSHASASGVRRNEAHLLQLARALRQILRRT